MSTEGTKEQRSREDQKLIKLGREQQFSLLEVIKGDEAAEKAEASLE